MGDAVRVWIDLANSPHPLLFEPIARRLTELGADVSITYRDHAQTAELARERWPDAAAIGGASPGGRVAKARGIAARVRALRAWARESRPQVALSHNSYAQLVAARSLGIAGVTAMDYEHQPANHVAFRAATRILVPDLLPAQAIARQGASRAKVVRYQGFKEEVYLGDFEPNPGALASAGVADLGTRRLVVARTSPAGASYHRDESPLLAAALDRLSARDDVVCVVLARHPEQAAALTAADRANVVVPRRVVDARSLLWRADAFLGAGGTMTREAALLGVPTYSLFAGPPAAVDAALVRDGALRTLTDARQVDEIAIGRGHRADLNELRARGARLTDAFAREALAAAR